jgi:MOSC domain-containing protein YiiM
MAELAVVRSVAVGRPVEIEGPTGRRTLTASAKTAVDGPVAVLDVHLEGDEQADPENHGGPHKAVYVYADEDVAWWREELGREVDRQTFGQNLTTAGVDLRATVVGERWRIGSAEFEVAQPRTPCFKLGLHSGEETMPRRFLAAVRPGAYLRVLTRGHVAAGDAVEVLHRPAHGVTLAEVYTVVHHERVRAERLLDAPELPPAYARWVHGRRVKTE